MGSAVELTRVQGRLTHAPRAAAKFGHHPSTELGLPELRAYPKERHSVVGICAERSKTGLRGGSFSTQASVRRSGLSEDSN